MIGRTLSHYRIVEPLGAGGMGEVYRAHDEKLGRDVAVKVLPADSLSDETARRRFQKEAEALVRLSHPHIATLFDVDSADGTDFIVMEVVPGPTLKERLQDGPLREKEVVRLGTQLVRGLMAAHEKGIVHRDLKPSNLSLTEDGLLKILDFGLVRLVQVESGGGETAPTETVAGRAAGTLPYMSPEQLRGRGVDARSDLYAVGAVLFELATGRRVFEQANDVELADAILHESPPSPRSHKSTLSPGLEAIVLKALDKDPELRYQTAREMLVDLERLQAVSTDPSGRGWVPRVTVGRRRRRWLAAATVLALLCAGVVWLYRPPSPPRVTNVRPLSGGLDSEVHVNAGIPTWATDGVRLYYLAMRDATLFQAPVTGGEPTEIPLPFGGRRRIFGYLAEETALLMGGSHSGRESPEGWPLWIVPVPAGAPRRLGDLLALHAAVSSVGERLALVQSGRRILVARRDGSPIIELGPLPSQPTHVAWHPDGTRLRYEALGEDGDRWIWEIPAGGGAARPLWNGRRGSWTPDGQYFLFEGFNDSEDRSDLYAVREGRLPWSTPGGLVLLTHGPLSFTDIGPHPDGTRLFAWGEARRGELLRYDEETHRFEEYLEGASAYYVDPSPDGLWLAWVSYRDGALWRGRPDGSDRLRLSPPGWQVHLPRWSPDGTSLVFAGRRAGQARLDILRIPSEGGEPEVLVRNETGTDLWDCCWLPDGQTILFSYEGSDELGIFQLDMRTREVSLFPGSERMQYPQCSSRGDVLAAEKPPEGGMPAWIFFAARGVWESLGDLPLGYASWTRDGRSVVALSSSAERGRSIARWSPVTGQIDMKVDVTGFRLLMARGGLAPDDSPLIVRDRSTRDIYVLEWDAP